MFYDYRFAIYFRKRVIFIEHFFCEILLIDLRGRKNGPDLVKSRGLWPSEFEFETLAKKLAKNDLIAFYAPFPCRISILRL